MTGINWESEFDQKFGFSTTDVDDSEEVENEFNRIYQQSNCSEDDDVDNSKLVEELYQRICDEQRLVKGFGAIEVKESTLEDLNEDELKELLNELDEGTKPKFRVSDLVKKFDFEIGAKLQRQRRVDSDDSDFDYKSAEGEEDSDSDYKTCAEFSRTSMLERMEVLQSEDDVSNKAQKIVASDVTSEAEVIEVEDSTVAEDITLVEAVDDMSAVGRSLKEAEQHGGNEHSTIVSEMPVEVPKALECNLRYTEQHKDNEHSTVVSHSPPEEVTRALETRIPHEVPVSSKSLITQETLMLEGAELRNIHEDTITLKAQVTDQTTELTDTPKEYKEQPVSESHITNEILVADEDIEVVNTKTVCDKHLVSKPRLPDETLKLQKDVTLVKTYDLNQHPVSLKPEVANETLKTEDVKPKKVTNVHTNPFISHLPAANETLKKDGSTNPISTNTCHDNKTSTKEGTTKPLNRKLSNKAIEISESIMIGIPPKQKERKESLPVELPLIKNLLPQRSRPIRRSLDLNRTDSQVLESKIEALRKSFDAKCDTETYHSVYQSPLSPAQVFIGRVQQDSLDGYKTPYNTPEYNENQFFEINDTNQ